MKKRLIPIALVMGALSANAQVGIGTNKPNKSAELIIESSNRGLLIPNVKLTDTKDGKTITNGNINSLMVFNTSDNSSIKPGYYYWFVDTWHRLTSASEIPNIVVNQFEQILNMQGDKVENLIKQIVLNTSGNVIYEGDKLYHINDAGEKVEINFNDIVKLHETVTTLDYNRDTNILTYVNEEGETKVVNLNVGGIEYSPQENRIIYTDGDGMPTHLDLNKTSLKYDKDKGVLTYISSDGSTTEINIKDLLHANETVTTIVKNTDGTYTYTNEEGKAVIIDVPGSVVENFENIYNDIVYKEITVDGDLYNSFEEYLTQIVNSNTNFKDNEFIKVEGDGTADSPFEITIKEGDADSMLTTNADGDLEWVSIADIVKSNETKTLLVANDNGTYTYYNEEEIDKDGNPLPGSGVTIDPALVNVEDLSKTEGKYIFKDSEGNDLATIDVNSSNILYDNSNSGLDAGNVQGALDEIVNNIAAAKGDLSIAGGLEFTGNTDGGGKLLADAGIQIADGGVTSDKIADKAVTSDKLDAGKGEEGRVGVADAEGNIIYESLDTLVKANETKTLLVANDNGTYTYYNEEEIDKDGKPLPGSGITIDPALVKVEDLSKTEGKYIFKDSEGNDLATIDVNSNNILYDNSNSGLDAGNVQDALDEIANNIAAAKGDLSIAGGLEFTGNTDGAGKLLADAGIQIADGGVTTDKIGDKAVTSDKLDAGKGEEGRVGVADAEGNIIYESLDTLVKANETKTLLVANDNGTYTYYNEEEIDKDGKPLPGLGITIDPALVKVEDLSKTEGKYIFKDSEGNDLATIDVNSNNILYDNSNSGLDAGNVQDALDEIVNNIAAAKGDLSIAGGLEFTGETDGGGKLLADAGIQIADGGVTTDKIGDKAVTSDKIQGGEEGDILVSNADGSTSWISNATSNTLVLVGNKLTSTVNGVIAEVSLTDENISSSKGITGTGITVVGGENSTLKDVSLSIAPGDDNTVMTTKDGVVTWVPQSEIVPNTTNVLSKKPDSNGNTLISTVNGIGSETTLIESAANSIVDGKLVTTINGKASEGLDLTDAVQAAQLKTEVIDGVNTTVSTDTDGNTTKYAVNVSKEAIQDAVTLDGDVTGTAGNNTLSKIQGTDLDTEGKAEGNALIFKDGKWIPGKPDINVENILNAKNLTTDGKISIASDDSSMKGDNETLKRGAVLLDTHLSIAKGSISTEEITDGTIKPEDLAKAGADNVLSTDSEGTPVWKKEAPRFFYMPAVIFDTAVNGEGERDLYQEYVNQFKGLPHDISHGVGGSSSNTYTGGLIRSAEAPEQIAVYDREELYYYVSYYDTSVFKDLEIDEDGVLTYEVIGNATPRSYMNIVFVIK